MREQVNTSVFRAIVHALPTAVLAIDSNDTVILANISASRLLGISREHLEDGSLSRFIAPDVSISSRARVVSFSTPNGAHELVCVAKEIIVDEDVLRVILLKPVSDSALEKLSEHVHGLAAARNNPYDYVCHALVDLGITHNACIRSTTARECTVLASTTPHHDEFSHSATLARTISRDDTSHVELVIIPHHLEGLHKDDLAVITIFVSLLELSTTSQESDRDAIGSETALALALGAGDMGMCFFDPVRGDCFLSDHLATWCGINLDSFDGTLSSWTDTFHPDDTTRIGELFSTLSHEKQFTTIIRVGSPTYESRIELHGRPLHDDSASEWVIIAKEFSDMQEVQAAWKTRIEMEEAARVDAENELENFEKSLVETLLPTTTDVSLLHSRQDAGTWHIVRQLDYQTCVYAVGAVSAHNRTQAVIGATLVATIADVLASQIFDIDNFVGIVRDHARARDIETSIAAVRVINGDVFASTHAGASVYISGKQCTGHHTFTSSVAMNLSTHSTATTETIDVTSGGHPWKIMSTVVHVNPQPRFSDTQDEVDIRDSDPNDIGLITGAAHAQQQTLNQSPNNVSPFRSGSISPTQ